MVFKDLLKIMIAKEGSDLFLTADAPPSIKAFGHMVPLGSQVLPAGAVEKIAAQLITPDQARAFEKDPELNIALSEPDIGRFRINIFKQRGQLAMVARHIKTVIPSCDKLSLPDTLKDLVMSKRGLVMFVGGTGSGKSTSLAALIDYRNQHSDGHIITVEDPIEFIHPHKKSIVSQREVGVDTASYESALKKHAPSGARCHSHW